MNDLTELARILLYRRREETMDDEERYNEGCDLAHTMVTGVRESRSSHRIDEAMGRLSDRQIREGFADTLRDRLLSI